MKCTLIHFLLFLLLPKTGLAQTAEESLFEATFRQSIKIPARKQTKRKRTFLLSYITVRSDKSVFVERRVYLVHPILIWKRPVLAEIYLYRVDDLEDKCQATIGPLIYGSFAPRAPLLPKEFRIERDAARLTHHLGDGAEIDVMLTRLRKPDGGLVVKARQVGKSRLTTMKTDQRPWSCGRWRQMYSIGPMGRLSSYSGALEVHDSYAVAFSQFDLRRKGRPRSLDGRLAKARWEELWRFATDEVRVSELKYQEKEVHDFLRVKESEEAQNARRERDTQARIKRILGKKFPIAGLTKISDGKAFTLPASGCVAVLWSIKCPACHKELRWLTEEERSDHGRPGVTIVAINAIDAIPKTREHVNALGWSFPVLSGKKDIFQFLGLESVPITVWIRADGSVGDCVLGYRRGRVKSLMRKASEAAHVTHEEVK